MKLPHAKILGSLMVAAITAFAFPQASVANQLKIGMSTDVTSMDPHFHHSAANMMVSFHVFETLTWMGNDGKLGPKLALSWQHPSDTEWEIKLRQGVKWHDGTDFTADDAIYSLGRLGKVEGAIGGFQTYVSAIASVEKIDTYTLKVTTSSPSPNFPLYLANIAMVPAKVATTDPAKFNSGEAMVGTGPYKFVSYTPSSNIKLKANDAWWGGPVEWSDVELRIVGNSAVRAASLLSGDLDLIEMPAAVDLERIKGDKNFSLVTAPALRVVYVNPVQAIADDGEQITDASGKPIKPNPLQDVRVRKALSMAINRDGIASRILLGAGTATSQLVPPGAFGYIPDYPAVPYDPEKAKSLLAEAGYPNGFTLPLTSATDRLPGMMDVAQAIAQMWSRIGVRTTVNGVPVTVYVRLGSTQKIPAHVSTWGNPTMEVGGTLQNILQTFDKDKSAGTSNWGRYSNPAFDQLLTQAMATFDTAEREKLLQKATRMAMDDYALLPLYNVTNIWAMRKGVTMEGRPDAATFAWQVKQVPE